MLKPKTPKEALSGASAAICLLLVLSSASLSKPGLGRLAQASAARRAQIPEATKPCSEEEGRWWQAVRSAGHEAAAARVRKDEAVRRRSIERYGYAVGDAERLLSAKERNALNTDITASQEKYSNLLREAETKSYRAPVADARPVVLYSPRPDYSEDARRNKISGVVIVAIVVRADGTAGEITISRGLKHGLDEKAQEAGRKIVFLPAIRDGVFVVHRMPAEVEFNLR